MAKGSAIIGKIKGHAGNLVFRVRKGEQIIQTKPGPRGKDHLPTYNQAWNYMRFKWASFMSQVTLELTDHSFTRKYRQQSSTNKFIQANIQNFNPINKKCANIYDLSESLPLTMNELQISSGTMAPVDITIGKVMNTNIDLALTDVGDGQTITLAAFREGASDQEKTYNSFDEMISQQGILANALKWARAKGLQPGEMLTLVVMYAEHIEDWNTSTGVRELPALLEMGFIRFKLDADNETFLVEPNQVMLNNMEEIEIDGTTYAKFLNAEKKVVGACIIHSREVYGGWECDDTTMRMIKWNTAEWADKFTWEQNARTLYMNNWSTQEMPLLDPASLTEAEQQMLLTGRVIETINQSNKRIYIKKVTDDEEEVIVEGKDIDVSKKKKRTSTSSAEE